MIYPDGESVHGQSVSHSVGILPREHAKKREDLSSCSATICRFLRSRFTHAHTHTQARVHMQAHTHTLHALHETRPGSSPLRTANTPRIRYALSLKHRIWKAKGSRPFRTHRVEIHGEKQRGYRRTHSR